MVADWTQQRILITGAARRLGCALAQALAARGAALALHVHRATEASPALGEQLSAASPRVRVFQADLADPLQLDRLIRDVSEQFGPLTGLVNNAAVYFKTPLHHLSLAAWDETLAVNTRAPVWLSARLGLSMKQAGRGSIVQVGDWSLERPYPNYLAYTVSKGALTVASRALARELAPEVRVNVVAPGPMLLPESAAPGLEVRIRRAVPLGRLGGTQPFVDAVLFLLSDASSYCSGTVLTVDGGRSLA